MKDSFEEEPEGEDEVEDEIEDEEVEKSSVPKIIPDKEFCDEEETDDLEEITNAKGVKLRAYLKCEPKEDPNDKGNYRNVPEDIVLRISIGETDIRLRVGQFLSPQIIAHFVDENGFLSVED